MWFLFFFVFFFFSFRQLEGNHYRGTMRTRANAQRNYDVGIKSVTRSYAHGQYRGVERYREINLCGSARAFSIMAIIHRPMVL